MDATLQDTLYGRIIAAVATRIMAINTAAGFHFSVKPESVVSDPVNPFAIDETSCPFFVVQAQNDKSFKRRWLPAEQVLDDWPLMITAKLIADGDDPFRKMALATNAYGDLEQALTHDPASPTYPAGPRELTLGLPEVMDIRLQPMLPPPIPGFEGDQQVYVVAELVVKFTRTYGAP